MEEVNDVGKVVISFNSTMFTNAALNETEVGGTAKRFLNNGFEADEIVEGGRATSYKNFSMINNGTVLVDGELKPSLQVEMKPFDPENFCASSLGFSWECTDYNESELVLQMYFENPNCISISKEGRDTILLTFYEQDLFKDISKRGIPPKMQIEKPIGRQRVT